MNLNVKSERHLSQKEFNKNLLEKNEETDSFSALSTHLYKS